MIYERNDMDRIKILRKDRSMIGDYLLREYFG